MQKPLQNLLSSQIQATLDFDFQRFVVFLYGLRYGSEGFTPLRERKDKGADGIIGSDTILACFGPKEYKKTQFERKLKDDFNSYQNNWMSHYPRWRFVVNHHLAPEQVTTIKSLKSDAEIHGLGQLLTLIDNELSNSQKRKVCKKLNINEMYFQNDFLMEIFDDLVEKTENSQKVNFKFLTEIEKKIQLNFNDEEQDDAKNEIAILMSEFGNISSILSSYEDKDKSIIKYKILSDFNKGFGSFKEKAQTLTNLYIGNYKAENDTKLEFYIRALVFYMFEQCLIGKKE